VVLRTRPAIRRKMKARILRRIGNHISGRPRTSAGESAANFSSRFQIFSVAVFWVGASEQLKSQLRLVYRREKYARPLREALVNLFVQG
jgi:hypothetical protein